MLQVWNLRPARFRGKQTDTIEGEGKSPTFTVDSQKPNGFQMFCPQLWSYQLTKHGSGRELTCWSGGEACAHTHPCSSAVELVCSSCSPNLYRECDPHLACTLHGKISDDGSILCRETHIFTFRILPFLLFKAVFASLKASMQWLVTMLICTLKLATRAEVSNLYHKGAPHRLPCSLWPTWGSGAHPCF